MANLQGGDLKKFIVIKFEDADRYLPQHDKVDLHHILKQISDGKIKYGKKLNNYLVINTDEDYADEVIEILKRNGHWG